MSSREFANSDDVAVEQKQLPVDPKTQLRGRALLEHSRQKKREQKANRKEGGPSLWSIADLPQVGERVEHIETGVIYEVIGHKNEGGNRGITLKVRDPENTDPKQKPRHLSPRAVDPID